MTHALSRFLGAVLAGSLVLTVSAPALADGADASAPGPDPAISRVMVQLEHAQQQFRKLTKSRTRSNRIKTLDRALHFLRSAREVATRREGPVFDELLGDIDPLLVRALNDKTRLHVARASFSKAARANDEALSVDDRNDTALGLRDEIIEATIGDFGAGSERIDDGLTVVEDATACRSRSLFGLRLRSTPDRHDRIDGVRGRTRFRLGSGPGPLAAGTLGTDDGDLRARFGAPPRAGRDSGREPGRTAPAAERPGAASGRLGRTSFGSFPRRDDGATADRSRITYSGSASGRLGTMSFGVFPQARNRTGESLPQGSGIGGAAAGRMGTMSFGVFPAVQNRAGRPVGHSSGVVRQRSFRNDAALRFDPGAVSH